MNPEKTYAKFIEPNASLISVGRKLDGCDCIVIDKKENELTVELCDYHTKTVKDGSTKYVSPLQLPAKPISSFGE